MARSGIVLSASLAVLAAAALASPAGASPGDDARLIRASSQGVTFEYATSRSASAVAPRTVWIAVPPGATVQVTSSILAEESIEGLRLGSTVFSLDAAIAPDASGGAPERGITLDALARAASSPPEAPPGDPGARLLGITGLRGLRVAAIEVRPTVYEPAGDRLRIATRLAVDCAFVPLADAATPAASPPRSAVFTGIEQAMLLNAGSADGFRGHAASASPRRLAAGPLSSAVEVRVAGKGVHEITGADFAAAGISLGGRDPRWFRLFTRPGLPLLAEDSVGAAYERAEVALRVDDGNDGRLDPDDRILFYAVGPSGWFDDYGVAGADTLDWLQNPYETHNVYLLQMDPVAGDAPRRWTTRDAAPVRPGAAPVDHVRARMHFEDDLFYAPESNEPDRTWNPWAGSRLSSFSGPVDVSLRTEGVVPARAARFQARVWGRSSEPFGPSPLQLDVSLNGQPVAARSWFGGLPQVIDTTGTWLVEGDNQLRLSFALPPGGNVVHEGYLMASDLVFDRRLLAVGDTLEFTAPDLAGNLAYDIAPFSDAAGLTLLDVTDPLRPAELTGWAAADTTAGRVIRFHDDRPGARYFAASAVARRRPALAPTYDTRDLRTGAADYLVICSDAFSGEAQRLAEHRRTDAPPFPGATAEAVRVGDIFAAYSGGRMDPAAIRDFLYDAVHGGGWSPAPSFVCFLGDASYDHRDIYRLGDDLGRTQVPTFQRNFWSQGAYSSDDWLVDLDVGADDVPGAGDVPDLVVGRLPAANAAEATGMVDKVLRYDRTQANDSWPQSGDWRNRLLWLIDDASQGAQPDPLGSEFTRQAEELDRAHLPTWLERVKVNLLEYPLIGGRTKPGAQQETIDQLRRGALVWFYVGRGNSYLLADEQAFRLADVAALGNGHLLPFFIAQTASVGLFDVPFITGLLGEAMVKDPNGGSIATYAATGVTYSFANYGLATALTDALFAPDRLDAGRTIGEAAFVAGRRAGGSPNDRLYQLLGDPGMRLATAPRDVRLAFFDDETGEALPDSLPRGRLVRVEAEVHRTRDSSTVDLASDFNGFAMLRVSDSPPVRSYPDVFGPGASYVGNPREAALALARVVDGRGSGRFVIPLAATPGPGARIQAWVEGPAGNASGAHAYTLGAARADPADVAGPRIEIQLGGIWGPVHGPSELFAVFLLDASGVRTLVDSTRHRVTISLDGAPPTDMTSSVRPVRQDAAVFFSTFQDLADGMHSVRVEASDNLAVADDDVEHRTSTEVFFRVAAVVAALEPRAFTFPNPFVRGAGTTLVFTGLRGGSHDRVDVQIHDVRGRRLRTLHGRGGYSSIQVPWDGRDDAGHALPPGVYLWRAVLSLYGGTTQEYSGRLVLLD